MNLKQYLTIMGLATILCWVAWIFVIININPFDGNTTGFIFFYITLFFSLIGTNSIIIFALYRLINKKLPLFRHVQKSFHEASGISSIIIFVLFLQGKGWLTIWNFGLFVMLTIVVVSFLFSMKRYQKLSF
ncbi:MAG: hypothetical protein GW939_03190 [Candidatus Magasanikbacteria bacterium]|nr:hypothetical protein [Candidatus Magasanikbacteria bacterium]NCS72289.1 hypothetical protein [Candidatus Magasanikbacteria bacterium]